MTDYSNPRTEATIENWPSGRNRVTAHFSIEQHYKLGERAVRTTTGKPKKLTYADKVRFVDGDDGRIYVASTSPYSNHIVVMRGTFDYVHETISQREEPGRHAELLMKLFGAS